MASTKKRNLSLFIKRMIPAHIVDNNPGFVDFMRGYLEYLESTGGPYDVISTLLLDNNIDISIDKYLSEYQQKFAPHLPKTNVADTLLVMKHLREFYTSKGTEDSFAWLFRAYFGEEISFYYPTVDILRCSDGKWDKPIYLIIDDGYGSFDTNLSRYIQYDIIGSVSGESGKVSGVVSVPNPLDPSGILKVQALSVIQSSEKFIQGESLSFSGYTGLEKVKVFDNPNSIIKNAGKWNGTDGQVSSNKYIQDNYYYQDMSYVLKVGISSATYKLMTKNAIHPAGTVLFGIVEMINILANSAKMAQEAFYSFIQEWYTQTSVSPIPAPNYELFQTRYINGSSMTYGRFEKTKEWTPYGKVRPIGMADHIPANDFVTKSNETFIWTIPADLYINKSIFDTQVLNSAWLTYGYFMANRDTNPLLNSIVPVGAFDNIGISYYEANPNTTLPYSRSTTMTNQTGATI